MRGQFWRRQLPAAFPDRGLHSWLTEPGSLTARCQRGCHHFAVRLLHSGRGAPLADSDIAQQAGRQCLVREVLLECDGVPVIFAHTSLSTAERGRLGRWLAGLGSRSLGSLLFAHPGFRRGPIEFCRLDARDPLYRRAAGHTAMPAQVWARRSRHSMGGQSVLVTEIFLPGLMGR